MAQTLPNGVVVPNENGGERISTTGVAEMRTLGSSVDAQLARIQQTAGMEPTELTSENLNEVVTPGAYSQSSSGAASLELNYPVSRAGRLLVQANSSRSQVTQMFWTYETTANQSLYVRNFYMTWGEWKSIPVGEHDATWETLTGKPSTFPPSAHTHSVGDVDGLQGSLDGKVDDADPRLIDARTPTAHTHPVDDVTGLSDRLAALEYDSGPRDISEEAPGLTSGSWTIQRVGPWVYTNLYDLSLTATAGTYWQQSGWLPRGFRPPQTPDAPYVNFDCTVRNSDYTPGPLRVDRFGGVVLYGVTGKIVSVTAVWLTSDPIPTTLPGTPA